MKAQKVKKASQDQDRPEIVDVGIDQPADDQIVLADPGLASPAELD